MLFELSEVQKQQALINNLQESKQNLQDRLIQSYSANQKNQTSLKQKLNAIIKQSALLIHVLREIQQGIQHKSLLPTILSQKDLSKLLYNSKTLPDWFDHVFSKEYEKEKINFETMANKIYKLHGLGEKNSQLVKGHWNLQILFKRYKSLSEKELQNIDIISEVENFQFLYKSCKEIFKKFLDMMVKKVLEFLENTVESMMLYSNQLKKVKSFDNRGIQRSLVLNQMIKIIQFPKNKENEKSNIDSRTTIKIEHSYKTGKIFDGLLSEKSHKNGVIKNLSTIQSLRQRQKDNNEYFLRRAQQNKNHLNDHQVTREIIKSARSLHGNNVYKGYTEYIPSENCIRFREESKDSSIRSAKSYYDDSLALKKYKSNANLLSYSQDTSIQKRFLHNKDLSRSIVSQEIPKTTKPEIKHKSIMKSHKCLHHCPHHDKHLNNHCSKHCDKVCTHEKTFFNNFGLDLPEMSRQYYKGLKSPRIQHTSRSKQLSNVYTSRQKNITKSKPYLRNSHDKHSDYQQMRMSPIQKENVRFYENLPLNNFGNYKAGFQQRNQRTRDKKAIDYLVQGSNRLRSPPCRVSDYQYN